MKALRFIIIVCILSLFVGFYNGYCENNSSSGVIVIGSSLNSSKTQIPESVPSADETSNSSAGVTTGSPFYEITGSRIGKTQVSPVVALPSEAEIVFVDAGIVNAFTIVRVDAAGKEIKVLGMSPERAIGHKLAKGTYKAYPEDLDGNFPSDKLSVKVQVKLIENIGGVQ
ncbi:MAG: hypothetical protein WCY09_02470 [Candidatus Omnitrophota bacterium]